MNTRHTKQTPLRPLAWCGWEMPIPADWRPLDLDGEWVRGTAIVGDPEQAIFQAKWWRPSAADFPIETWLRHRQRRLAAWRADEPVRPRGIDTVAQFPEVPSRGGGSRELWYGYSKAAGLVLEIAINQGANEERQKTVLRHCLPELRLTAQDAPMRWAVYETGFTSPPGFVLLAWRFYAGDITLRLQGPQRARLTLRQVYPATAALSRRPMDKWLYAFPFKEHRRLRVGRATKWQVGRNGQTLHGLQREGRKQFGAPFGFLAARDSLAAALHDTENDRLLLAEVDTREPDRKTLLETAMQGMNWMKGGIVACEENAPNPN